MNMPDFTRGSCTTSDPAVMTPATALGEQAAKRVCRHCPILQTCGEWALRTGQEAGVWGGMTERERRSLVAEITEKAA